MFMGLNSKETYERVGELSETTIKDIAKQCGVSVSTVSRALNNHPDIRPDTREKIMQTIQETGFVPNDSARFLKRSEGNGIALLVKGIMNPFFSSMIQVIEGYISEKNYTTILRHVGNQDDELTVAQSLIKERRLKGIVFLGGRFVYDEKRLKQLKVPYVFSTIGNMMQLGRDGSFIQEREESDEITRLPAPYANIAVDDVASSRKAVEYLIGLGHRNIGMISEGIHDPSIGQLRLRGYRYALEKYDIPYREDWIYEANEGIEHYSPENGYKGAKYLLETHPEMTAVFCISDMLAIGACRAIVETGRRIPEDISVIGYDGIDLGDFYIPRLTTVRQPIHHLAEETIDLLFDMIDKKRKPENIIMPAKLVIKESAGLAPQ